MLFCSPFDATLAASGPAAIFLPDREGLLRFDAEWTRDAWGRAPGPHEIGLRWALVRDHTTGFVGILLVSSPTLLVEHPHMDVRLFDTQEDAEMARAHFGNPPVSPAPW